MRSTASTHPSGVTGNALGKDPKDGFHLSHKNYLKKFNRGFSVEMNSDVFHQHTI